MNANARFKRRRLIWKKMNIFNQIAKSLIESAHGRIRTMSNGFSFSDAGTTNAQGVHIKACESKDGRMMSLSLGVLTASNCPKPPADYPEGSGGFKVPMKVCRKCPHHIKRHRRQPYPCCAVLREIRAKGPSPIEQFGAIMKSAKEKAAEIMR